MVRIGALVVKNNNKQLCETCLKFGRDLMMGMCLGISVFGRKIAFVGKEMKNG